MPRNYTRKTDRRLWTEAALAAAVKAIRMGLSKRQAASIYKIPRKTLSRYLSIDRSSEDGPFPKISPLGSFSSVFNAVQEEELVKHVLQMNQYGLGVTREELRSLAFQLAEKNKVSHPFCHNKQLAGRDWLAGFLKRHPEISIRSAEPTSLARLKGFNRCSVDRFFELLQKIYNSDQFPPNRIWNADETGCSTVPTKASKVLAKKGARQVAGAVSAERGVNTTAIMAMSAAGEYIPPMIIFPRKRMNEALKVGAPEGSIFACNESGLSTTNTFSVWFDHFVAKTKPTAKSPVLLILDGHSSHTRNVEVLEKAKKNHVRILSIPPHTSHKLQPLDVSFMGPFKSNYNEALKKFQKENQGKAVTIFNVVALINSAYSASASILTAKNGFKATGISPINRHIFTDEDFAASDFLNADPSNENSNPIINAQGIDAASDFRNADLSNDDVEDNHTAEISDPNIDAQGVIDVASEFRNADPSNDVVDNLPVENNDLIINSHGIIDSVNFVNLTEPFDQSINQPSEGFANIANVHQQFDTSEFLFLDPNVYYSVEDNGNIIVHTMISNDQSIETNTGEPVILSVPEEGNELTSETHCVNYYGVSTAAEQEAFNLRIDTDTDLLVLDPTVHYSVDKNGNIVTHSLVANNQNVENNSSGLNVISPTPVKEKENQPSSEDKPRLWDCNRVPTKRELKGFDMPPTITAPVSKRKVKPLSKRNVKENQPSNEDKPRRWDWNRVPTKGELKGFDMPPTVTTPVSKRNVKRLRAPKSEQSQELTSSPYRKKLLKDNAAKEIRNIKKKDTVRKDRKRKSAANIMMEDILCSFCGIVFSWSENGEGWMMCVQCKTWFHTECATNPSSITCDMCV